MDPLSRQASGRFDAANREKVQFLRNEYTFPGGIKADPDSSDPKIKIDNQDLTFLGDVFKLESTICLRGCARRTGQVKAMRDREA